MIGNVVFVVEEFLIDIRDYNVSRLVKYKTPTESYSGSDDSDAIIWVVPLILLCILEDF